MSVLRNRSRLSNHTGLSGSRNSKTHYPAEKVTVENISKHTWFEKINYKFDVLVPLDEQTELMVPMDSYTQQVHYGHVHKWRVQKNKNYNLPLYLTEDLDPAPSYEVFVEKKGWFTAFEPGSPFLKKWDTLTLMLLLFTASVTPFETAYIKDQGITFDLLFLINRFVDVVFFIDMFIQMRTPFRDDYTGKLVLDVKSIAIRYATSWFPVDVVSVIPFEFLGIFLGDGQTNNLSQLKLLRFVRLTRLLKLLRVFRASRKLKQAQIASGLRYFSVELLKIVFVIIFCIHWLACGYRLVADRSDTTEEIGWIELLAIAKNTTNLSSLDAYVAGLYWASGVVSMVGVQSDVLAPKAQRELFFAVFANFFCFFLAIYYIATLSSIVQVTGEEKRKQEILLDYYLELFDTLRLDPRLKFQVAQHLVDYFTTESNHKQASMLKRLPKSLHCFISLEIYMDFILRIPFLEPFIDMNPVMIQEIAQGIEKRNIPFNNCLFEEGCDGVYLIEEGIVAMDGFIYPSGSMIGLACLRTNNKKVECRAITDVKSNYLPRLFLLDVLARYPKVKYYINRWTIWEVLREYIRTYARLYYTAARRGATMSPPLLSKRPNMEEDEEDDIDVAVLDHIEEMGF